MTIELELFNTDRASASFTFHYRTLCWPLPIMLFFFVVAVILHPSIHLVLFPIEFVKQRDTHTHRHKKDRIPSLYGVFSHDKTFMLHPLRQKVTWTPGGWVLLASWFYHPPSIICFRSLVFTDRLFFLLPFFGDATRHSLLQSTVGLIKEGAGRSKKRGIKQTERNCYHFFSSSFSLSSVYRSVPFDFVSAGEHLFAASVWVKDEPGGNECTDHF